jgi:von Willebrand factor type A domain
VLEALKKFDKSNANQNVVLLISDGLDTSRGFDSDSTINSIDLQRAVREAKQRNVAVYAFYAPTVGLSSFNHIAVSYGQSALNRIADETGGRAFFQGTSFVTFDSYFDNLRRVLNERYAPVS